MLNYSFDRKAQGMVQHYEESNFHTLSVQNELWMLHCKLSSSLYSFFNQALKCLAGWLISQLTEN